MPAQPDEMDDATLKSVGRLIYDRAKAAKIGLPIAMDWFQQDIRD